jgi:hypothetical protein
MKKIDELGLVRLRQAYINSTDKTKQALWSRLSHEFSISVSTIRRNADKGSWDELRQANLAAHHSVVSTVKAAATTAAVEAASGATAEIAGEVFDTEQMLIKAIQLLANDLPITPSKSKEGVANTLGKLIELYRKLHPRTVPELVELTLSVPEFDVHEFARLLRERMLGP